MNRGKSDRTPPRPTGEHYLKSEFFERVASDPTILDFIQNDILDGLWYWDLENPDNEWHSPRFGELFGYDDSEIPDSPEWCRQHCLPDDYERAIANFHKHCADPNHPYCQEMRYRHRDGSIVWVLCRGIVIRDDNGKPLRMIGANTDITSLKLAQKSAHKSEEKLRIALTTTTDIQERLIHTERLKALGQMSSSIAHEFNNLLAKMQGLLGEVTPTSERNAKTLSQIEALIGEGSTVVRSLGNFHPGKSGSENVKSVDLSVVVEDTIKLTRPHWESEMLTRGTNVHIEAHFEEGIEVQIDPLQFREVLTSLIFNSCDAMPEDGLLSFTTKKQKHSVVLEVTDNGCGMTSETLSHCRDTFFSTKDEGSSGLGLSLAETIVRGFGGELSLHSTPQLGTTVTIRLPINDDQHHHDRPQTEAGKATAKDSPARRSLHILVVDDEPIIARLITQLLAVDGHQVEFVTSASEALSCLSESFFDAVLSDRSMPHMNGDQLALEVAEQFPGKTFIMVTGYGDIMTSNAECPAGVDLVLGKPVNREELRKATRIIASRTPTLSS